MLWINGAHRFPRKSFQNNIFIFQNLDLLLPLIQFQKYILQPQSHQSFGGVFCGHSQNDPLHLKICRCDVFRVSMGLRDNYYYKYIIFFISFNEGHSMRLFYQGHCFPYYLCQNLHHVCLYLYISSLIDFDYSC